MEKLAAIRFGAFELEVPTGDLRRRKSGALVKLPPQSLNILNLLVKNAPRLVSRKDIQEQVWKQETTVDFEQGLNCCVKQIRAALGDTADAPHYVQTHYRRGYRFIAPVEVLAESNVEPQSREGAKRLAVLPFQTFSSDGDERHFADGLTDVLIASIAKLKTLHVISRTSTIRYKETRKRMAAIAHELNVDYLLEGTVIHSGAQTRVVVQLIEGETDRHVWSTKYEYAGEDILVLQSDIATEVANEIRMQLTSEEISLSPVRRSVDPEAHEACLKGRHCWNKRTKNGVRKAIQYFNYAIRRDPTCAEAYAGLADAYMTLGYWQMTPIKPKESFERARTAARKAIDIDDTLAEAYSSMGYVKACCDFDWPSADDYFKKALQLKPSQPASRYWYAATCLAARGQSEEAFEQCREALKLDPLSGVARASFAWCYYLTRQFDAAIEQARKALELNPRFAVAHYTIGVAYEQQRNYREAIAELGSAVGYSGGNPIMIAGLAHAYAVVGRTLKARESLRKLISRSMRDYASPYDLALVLTGLGQKDEAMRELRKSRGMSAWLVYVATDARFDSLRDHPQFKNFLHEAMHWRDQSAHEKIVAEMRSASSREEPLADF